MIEIKIEGAGNERFFKSTLNFSANTRYGIEKALWKSGKDLQAEFRRQVLSKNKTGRLYILKSKSGRRKFHKSSAPEETAANLTGLYRKSSSFSVNGAHELAFGNTAPYAAHLEYGTKKNGKTRMRRRPGLLNTVTASERDIIRNLTTDISAEL